MTAESERQRAEAAQIRARFHPGASAGGLSGNPMAQLSPEFAATLGDRAMSRYGDETIDLKTRALCTVAALAALGQDRYTQNWIGNALQVGATRAEVVSLLEQLEPYIGIPRAVGAFGAAKAAFEQYTG